MAVVINEFEVVNEPAAQGPAPSQAAAKPAPAVDVARALAAMRAREQRVGTY